MSRFSKAGPRMTALLQRAGSHDLAVARDGMHQLAKALTTPLRQGVLKGDIVTDLYEVEDIVPGTAAEYPLDFLTPGTESEYTAYTIPAQGRIPEKHVEGDYVMVPTYEVGASIDFALKYAREARWNIVGRALEVLEGSFVRKLNTDGWRVIVAAGYGRMLTVYDDKVAPGFFSKRVVELMKNLMRRQGGGNSTSTNRGKMTRLYTSPEALGDVRGWDVFSNGQVDPQTMRDIYMSAELDSMRLFGVDIRSIDELGVGQEFQQYYLNQLGGALPSYSLNSQSQTKLELVVGVDTYNEGAFYMPRKQEVEIFEDPTFHRQRRASLYGWAEHGFACLDGRRVLLGAI
jgi:hypothetical protein